jgi:hypothetical protein
MFPKRAGKIIKKRTYVSKFDPYKTKRAKEGSSDQKVDNNKKFVRCVVEAMKLPQFAKEGDVLYFDDISARTTRMLIKKGISIERLKPLSCDREAYKSFVKYIRPYESYNMYFSDLLNRYNGKPFAAIWLDTCSTLGGSAETRKHERDPISDLIRLFSENSRNFLTNGTVFAVTYCRRGSVGRPVDTKENIEEIVNGIMKGNGYQSPLYLQDYGRQMSFGVTEIKREN